MLERQRILICGDSGYGKSRAALSFADEMLLERPDAKVAVIDCDDSMDYEIEKFPRVQAKLVEPSGNHPYWFKITGHDALVTAKTRVLQYLGAGDILIFEGLERGWELSQDAYTEAVFGKSTGEHLQSLRASAVAASRLEAPVSFDNARDWPSIRKLWKNDVLIPLTVNVAHHVIATASSKQIVALSRDGSTSNVNPFVKAIFGEIGIAPEGEKSDVKRFDIAVCLGINRGNYILSVAKNRERTGLKPADIPWTSRPFWATLKNAIEPPPPEPEAQKQEVAV